MINMFAIEAYSKIITSLFQVYHRVAAEFAKDERVQGVSLAFLTDYRSVMTITLQVDGAEYQYSMPSHSIAQYWRYNDAAVKEEAQKIIHVFKKSIDNTDGEES